MGWSAGGFMTCAICARVADAGVRVAQALTMTATAAMAAKADVKDGVTFPAANGIRPSVNP
jgi:hypothetical protein